MLRKLGEHLKRDFFVSLIIKAKSLLYFTLQLQNIHDKVLGIKRKSANLQIFLSLR